MERIIQRRISFKYQSLWLVSLLCIFMTFSYVSLANSYPDDPIPTLDFGESERSMIVVLNFSDMNEAELGTVLIVPGPSHGWAGDPPLLRIELLDLDGDSIQEFNAWHPLMSNYEDEYGFDRGIILEEATGNIPFPFSNEVAKMVVTNIQTQKEIISVDLVPALHDFCRDNLGDPDCDYIVNRPPVCDANGPYSVECAGAMTSLILEGTASSDPDGDPLNLTWSDTFTGGTANGFTPTVEYSSYGQFEVDLYVSDDFGGAATCSADINVVDTTAPDIECNAPTSIIPPDATISFMTSANDACIGEVTSEITEFDCFNYTKKGRRIDKTESCVVTINGDTISILDSGGVGDRISWTVFATDDNGNTGMRDCIVEVVNPGSKSK